MADGDLVVRFGIDALIQGARRKLDMALTDSGMVSCLDQLVPLSTTKTTLWSYAADEAGGVTEDWECMILSNEDSSIAVDVALSSSAANTDSVWVQIPAGRFFVLWNRKFLVDDDAVAGAAPPSYVNIELVEAAGASGNPIVRVLVFDDTAASA